MTDSVTNKKLGFLELLFIVYLSAIYILPSFSLNFLTVIGIIILYSVYLVINDKNHLNVILKVFVIVLILSIVYTLLTDTKTISGGALSRDLKRILSKMYQYLSLYFPLFIFLRVNNSASSIQKKFLVSVALVMMAFVMITTRNALIYDSTVTREWLGFDDAAKRGVANYYFIYAIPVVISIFSACFVKLKLLPKVISAIIIVLSLIFLINAQYTLSVLISVIGILYQIFQSFRSFESKFFFILCAVIVAFFLPNILKFVIDNINASQVVTRLSEIYDFLTGKGAGGYNLNGRLTLYWKSIKAFLQSPIHGNSNLNFDGHATFLTVLCDTGLLGGIPFYSLLYIVCKTIFAELKESKKQFKTIVFMFVLMGLTNPVHASMPLGFACWFIAPLMISVFFGGNKNESLEN